jgi:hypothetical protein
MVEYCGDLGVEQFVRVRVCCKVGVEYVFDG